MHGWVLKKNQKMSKSLGNFIESEDLINGTLKELKENKKYSNIKGIETFRFYSIGATQPGRDLNFDVKEYADTFKAINTIWNVYVYANEKFTLANFNPSKVKIEQEKLSQLDKWILSRINSTIKKVTELSDNYKLPWIPQQLRDLIVNDISRWYLMLNREKIELYSEDPNKFQTMAVLFNILFKVLLLLAPINPMLSEEIFLKMFNPYLKLMGLEETKSIHLQDWPKVSEEDSDLELEEQMQFTRDIIELVRALKDENKIRLRWPNKKIIIEPKEGMPEIKFPAIIKQIGNVKELEIIKSIKPTENLLKGESKYCNIYLDNSVDDELIAERVESDLLRNIQFTRKKNKFQTGELVKLIIGTEERILANYLEKNKGKIAKKVAAKEIEILNDKIKQLDDFIYEEIILCPNNKCHASLKSKFINKLHKNKDLQCPYCNNIVNAKDIINITFQFKKI